MMSRRTHLATAGPAAQHQADMHSAGAGYHHYGRATMEDNADAISRAAETVTPHATRYAPPIAGAAP